MKLLEENPNRLISSLLVAELIKSDINHFYVSPGMRNAPLLSALKNNKKAKVFLGIDERAQAYRAMGSSKASGRPSVLICTSGTAVLNYMPALAEATRSHTPLIVISADRPDELIWGDANQTMNQKNLFEQLEIPTWNIPTSDETFPLKELLARVDRWLHECKKGKPIHFNMPFREPLDGKLVKMDPTRSAQARSLFERPGPVSVMAHQQGPLIQNEELEYFKKPGLLVIGELAPNTDRAPLKSVVEKLEWPVFLDVLSGLKYDFSMKDGAIPTFDHPEIIEYFNENKPEVIVHIGGRMTSKFYHHFLENNPQIKMLHVTPKISKNMAPSSADYTREAEPSAWATQLLESLEIKNKRSDFETGRWVDFVERKRKLIDESDLCYPQISKTLIENLPPSCDLYLGNSTVIRSFDSYTGFESFPDIRTIGHRGVSGIEGFIAAAQGLRESDDHGPVILVLGDISFLHDLNSLMLLNENDRPILIVLVNNFGGGIFSLLPLEKGEEILPWMCTPHEIVFENVSKSFQLKYDQCTDKNGFIKVIDEFKKQTSGVRIVELLIDNSKNTEVYQKLKTVRL